MTLLQYLYTDETSVLSPQNLDFEAALSLLSVADQFLVESLKLRCEVPTPPSLSRRQVCNRGSGTS